MVPTTIVLLALTCVEGEAPYIVIGAAIVVLALGLTGAGKLIEIVRALRRQIRQFNAENEKLEGLNAALADQVANLQKLKLGFEKLQELCGGNVQKAAELIKKSNTKIKMEAMAVVTNLFKHHDLNKNLVLVQREKDAFYEALAAVFHALPGFHIDKIKAIIGADELNHKKIKNIVDEIAFFAEGGAVSGGAPVNPEGG